MHLTKTLLAILLFYSLNGYSQPKKNLFAIGAEISLPAHQPFQSNKATGLGINMKGEHFFSNNFSALANIGFASFRGKIVYWDGVEDRSFSLVPILIGARFYIQKLYLGIESGAAIKASENANTLVAFSPSIGMINKKLDLAIKFFAIPQMPSIPENTFLQKGGYSYLGISVFYSLNN
jgi:hypothetical protein